jgi:hypothetical protein
MQIARSGERPRVSTDQVETIVAQSARLYFESRRSRVNAFVDRHFSLFPFGATLGGIWYSFFPVTASPGLIAGATGTVMAAGAVMAAFSGIIADPLQRHLGLHRRRLLRLIDALEEQFNGDGGAGLVVRDHCVARLLTLLELLSSAYRLARP